MAYSRVTFPLYGFFLIALAGYIAYVLSSSGLFYLSASSELSSSASTLTAGSSGEDIGFAGDTSKDLSSRESLTTLGSDGAKAQRRAELNSGAELPAQTFPSEEDRKGEVVKAISSGVGVLAQGHVLGDVVGSREYELRLLWEKYGSLVPRLFSKSFDFDTKDVLARVGQLSMELDLWFQRESLLSGATNQSSELEWVARVVDVQPELIGIAVAGEREAARVLSFQFAQASRTKMIDAMAWAMIANAIVPNDYYVYLCWDKSTVCTESVFALASERAKEMVKEYEFVQRK